MRARDSVPALDRGSRLASQGEEVSTKVVVGVGLVARRGGQGRKEGEGDGGCVETQQRFDETRAMGAGVVEDRRGDASNLRDQRGDFFRGAGMGDLQHCRMERRLRHDPEVYQPGEQNKIKRRLEYTLGTTSLSIC